MATITFREEFFRGEEKLKENLGKLFNRDDVQQTLHEAAKSVSESVEKSKLFEQYLIAGAVFISEVLQDRWAEDGDPLNLSRGALSFIEKARSGTDVSTGIKIKLGKIKKEIGNIVEKAPQGPAGGLRNELMASMGIGKGKS